MEDKDQASIMTTDNTIWVFLKKCYV